jgi:hypothetical protein
VNGRLTNATRFGGAFVPSFATDYPDGAELFSLGRKAIGHGPGRVFSDHNFNGSILVMTIWTLGNPGGINTPGFYFARRLPK